jgi:hypothetical protein
MFDIIARRSFVFDEPQLSELTAGRASIRLSPARGNIRFHLFYGPLIVWVLGAAVIRRAFEHAGDTQYWQLRLRGCEITLTNEPFVDAVDLLGEATLVKELFPLILEFSTGRRGRPYGGLQALLTQ